MSIENTADRLVADARDRSTRGASSTIGLAALIVGAIGVLAGAIAVIADTPGPLPAAILGAIAVGLGIAGRKRPASAKQATIGLWLGVAAFLIGIFVFNTRLAMLLPFMQ